MGRCVGGWPQRPWARAPGRWQELAQQPLCGLRGTLTRGASMSVSALTPAPNAHPTNGGLGTVAQELQLSLNICTKVVE